MTVWFVTTGTSLLTSSRCWVIDGDSAWQDMDSELTWGKFRHAFPQQAEQISITKAGFLDEGSWDRTQPAKTACHVVKEHVRPECLSVDRAKTLPAELATLVHLVGDIQALDRIVFLHGSGNQALQAHLLAKMTDRLLLEHEKAGVVVELRGPYEWDPAKTEEFNDAVTAMWREIDRLWADSPARFVLTGGYKSLVMSLAQRIALSERGTHIYSLHEEQGEVIEILFPADGTPATVQRRPKPPLKY